MYTVFAIALIIAVLLIYVGLHAPAAIITDGRGKGEPVFRYIGQNAKDYRGFRKATREEIDMSHPVSEEVHILWADGSASTFTGDGYLQQKLLFTKAHAAYLNSLAGQAGH